ncbi:alpha-1,3-fucosyl transferase [Helicobacter aurati]|uniref:Alpha-1,3-fucosyl transferase n=2 Tax=Helicobacter aurati TaxID=137778 RepID=A0A3D8J3Y0_9HELI|nr:glycosyltransferase family 10 [Helicobacter aurati]RDU71564.1 alpha-1,3-fucosyl transferase [Helicobacter aurati]
MKKAIAMRIVDWDDEENEENFYKNYFVKILSKKYHINYSDKPDFLLYGSFGKKHLQYECVRIFYTGENVRTDWNIADYGIDFDFLEFGDRHLHLPLFMLYTRDLLLAATKHSRAQQFMESKQKFCSFLASNPHGDPYREQLFKAICQYKKVDSGGQWLNNIGFCIGDRYSDFSSPKAEWLPAYKFNLCPENSSYLGYVTEKIIQSYANGCVPIYWGDWSLCDKQYATNRFVFNPRAFINAHDFENFADLLEEIKRIDNDDNAYFAMLKEPAFLDLEQTLKNSQQDTFTNIDNSDFSLDDDMFSEFSNSDIYIYIYIYIYI